MQVAYVSPLLLVQPHVPVCPRHQAGDEKVLVSAIQELEGWSATYTDPQERRVMAQAVWHSAYETERPGATASAAFHGFRPEMLAQLKTPKSRPMSEIVILGAQHEKNLGGRVIETASDGHFMATLERLVGKRRIEGHLAPLRQ